MISDKVIFQYGNANEANYIFYKQKFTGQLNNGVKEQRSESALMDGSQRLNGANRNKRAGYLFQYDFRNPFFSIFTPDFINRVFYGEPRIAFWYQVEAFMQDDGKYIRPPKQWFYNLADCTIPPSIKEDERANNATPDNAYSIGLTLEKPYLYDCTVDLEYIDLQSYIDGLTTWGSFNYNAANWGSSFTPSAVSGLTDAQISEFFVNLNVRNINYFVYLRDRFFNRDTTQTNRNYVINQTVAANSELDVLTSNAFRSSPVDNQIYRLEISQLSIGKSLTFSNTTNNTGLKLNWVDSTSSPSNLVFNSYTGKLYSGTSEIEISSDKYRVEAIGDRALYFSGLLNPRPFDTFNNENIRVINNGTGSVVVKIDALIAY
jgi:hypothetical protein